MDKYAHIHAHALRGAKYDCYSIAYCDPKRHDHSQRNVYINRDLDRVALGYPIGYTLLDAHGEHNPN